MYMWNIKKYCYNSLLTIRSLRQITCNNLWDDSLGKWMLPLYLVFWCLICSRRLSLTLLTNGKRLQDLAWLLTVIERDKAWGLYPHLDYWSSVSHKVRFDQVSQRFILAEWSDGSWGRWEGQRTAQRQRGERERVKERWDEMKWDHKGDLTAAD